MSSSIAVPSVAPATAASQALPVPPRTPQGLESGTAPGSPASNRPLTNPSLHLDLALNLVVLEFTDDKGAITQSIPSQKQLQAYRDQRSTPSAPDATFTPE